jgi:hypothetical protein
MTAGVPRRVLLTCCLGVGLTVSASLLQGCAAPDSSTGRSLAAPWEQPGWSEVLSAAGRWRVFYRTLPDSVPINEPFRLELFVLGAEDGRLPVDLEVHVDGRMPQHQHGMLRRARYERRADGGFTAAGLLFHMPGDWTLMIDVRSGAITERAEIQLRPR